MSSIRRKISSRLNGALSKGPITKEGKRRSSQNAISHGLCQIIVSDVERPEGFFSLIDQHMGTFQPVNGVELGLVEEMCAAQWRMQRSWCIENGLLNQALAAAKDAAMKGATPPKDTGVDRLVKAFHKVSQDDAFRLVDIYEGRLHRRYHRAIKTLLLLRENQQSDLDPCPPSDPDPEPVEESSPAADGNTPECQSTDNGIAHPENQMDKPTHFTDSLWIAPAARYSLRQLNTQSAAFHAGASPDRYLT